MLVLLPCRRRFLPTPAAANSYRRRQRRRRRVRGGAAIAATTSCCCCCYLALDGHRGYELLLLCSRCCYCCPKAASRQEGPVGAPELTGPLGAPQGSPRRDAGHPGLAVLGGLRLLAKSRPGGRQASSRAWLADRLAPGPGWRQAPPLAASRPPGSGCRHGLPWPLKVPKGPAGDARADVPPPSPPRVRPAWSTTSVAARSPGPGWQQAPPELPPSAALLESPRAVLAAAPSGKV